jgi:orotidine-5'-phosphate decarboxylase
MNKNGQKIFRRPKGIIIACDVNSLDHLKKLVEGTFDLEGVTAYKISSILSIKYGLEKVAKMISKYTDLPLIYDHQKAGTDIPALAEKFAIVCREAGVTGVILFPLAGPATLKPFVEAIKHERLVPIVGGAMTHQEFLNSEGGYITKEGPRHIYDLASRIGVNHFVLPGTKGENFSEYLSSIIQSCDSPVFLIPGIGTQGGNIEQAFALTHNHDSHAIIGSAIYDAPDIRKTAEHFANQAIGL